MFSVDSINTFMLDEFGRVKFVSYVFLNRTIPLELKIERERERKYLYRRAEK